MILLHAYKSINMSLEEKTSLWRLYDTVPVVLENEWLVMSDYI